MTIYSPGDVLLMPVPFTDSSTVKQRPVLVLFDNGFEDVVVARITRHPAIDPEDVEISDWQHAGLNARSFVRLHKLATLKKSLVIRKLGGLSDADRGKIRLVVRNLFSSF